MEVLAGGLCVGVQAAAPLAVAMLAYIDPGSGSLVFQIVVAGLLTTGLMIRGVRDRIVFALSLPFGRSRKAASGRCQNPSDADEANASSTASGKASPGATDRRAA